MNSSKRSEGPRITVDLNADLGEGFPNDRRLLEQVTSASVSCGAHAGDPSSIRATLAAARDLGVIVGAHPGYPDRENFGRREQTLTAARVERLILEQVEYLAELAGEERMSIRFLKPHGALYNQAQRQPEIAEGVVAGAVGLGLPLLGQPGTLLARMAAQAGIRLVAEGFPDRRYQPDGSLVPRTRPDALVHGIEEISENVSRLVENGVETLCIHGDDPEAVSNVNRVRHVLKILGIGVDRFLHEEGDSCRAD